MSKRILITGATGKTGRELARHLAARGHNLRLAVRDAAKASAVFGPDYDFAHFDYHEPKTYAPLVAGVDRMYLVAATGPDGEPQVQALVDAAVKGGVKHIVFLTAAGVQDDPNNALGRLERYVAASGADYTFLRPNWFMQNFDQGFIYPMIEGTGSFFLPAGDAKVSFIDVRDIAAVAAGALTGAGHAGQAYTLTGGEALSFGEAAEVISTAAGREVRYVPITDEQMRASMAQQGADEAALNTFSGLFAAVRAGYAAAISPAVEQVLGRPPITFEQYARDHVAAWR